MKFKFLYTSLALFFFAYLFMSSSGGRSGAWAGAPADNGYCISCHTDVPTGGGIMLSGAPSSYVPGVTYPLTLTLTNSAAVVGGFQIVATDNVTNNQMGVFSTPAGTKLNDISRLVQSMPKNFSGGSVSWTFNWIAPAMGAPAQVRFYFAGNAANGNGFNGAGDVSYSSSSALIPLPVELSYFEAKLMNDNKVKLTWQTQSELDNDYFEIQRNQKNDDNQFKTIGRIFSEGNSTEAINYTFEDEQPILNQYSYYRLKQVDLDGAFTFSDVQSVKIGGHGSFDIFPNPIQNKERLNISYVNVNNLEKRVHIVNLAGAVVFESILSVQEGKNNLAVEMPNLSSGVYFVSIFENKNLIEVKKLIVKE